MSENVVELWGDEIELPPADNTREALKIYRAANERFREMPWPEPFHRTSHEVRLGDARDLSWIDDSSVHLVVTSPPYWTLKEYPQGEGQLGAIENYEAFLDELNKAWGECERVLVPGGRLLIDSTNSNPLWTLFYPRYAGLSPRKWAGVLRNGGALPGWEGRVHHYREREFMEWLRSTGFLVEDLRRYGPRVCPKWQLAVAQRRDNGDTRQT